MNGKKVVGCSFNINVSIMGSFKKNMNIRESSFISKNIKFKQVIKTVNLL